MGSIVNTKERESVDKWGQPIKMTKLEEPPYGDLEELRLLNVIKVCHILVDDPNIALYVQEMNGCLNCYLAKNPAPNT